VRLNERTLGGVLVLCWLTLGSTGFAFARDTAKPAKQTTDADNTKMNKRDRASSEPTADQAKNNASDREVMQKIRQSLMDDKSLSSYAHNVKVIAQHGKVTLKGPVHSADEKKAVEDKATEIAGAGNVINRITVKADKGDSKQK
jgi:hyperosmotically inducible protein